MPIHSTTLGDYEIIAIQAQPDRLVNPVEFFPSATAADFERAFASSPQFFGASASEMRFTQNIVVVRTAGQTILVDTGIPVESADAWLLPGLAEAGISPNDIDIVILTHRDTDHVGGNMRAGEPTYPNARYVMARTEFEDFQSDSARAELFANSMTPLPRLEIVADDAEITVGIRFWLTPGHRSGAASLLVGDVALLVADVWHAPVQVAHPEWSIKFDSDPALAAITRREVVDFAEKHHLLVAVPHTPFFGLGTIANGRWVQAAS